MEKEILNGKHNYIIYGAGMVGELVYKHLSAQGMSDKVICFAVTHADSKKMLFDKPIYEIKELTEYRNTATVVIATFQKLHQEMQIILKKNGFFSVILVTNEMYEDMAAKYIEDFNKRVRTARNHYDVLLMASDNNSSSGAFLCMAELAAKLPKENIYPLVVLPEYGNGEKELIKRKIDYLYVPSKSWCIQLGRTARERIDNAQAIKRLEELINQYGIRLVHNNTSYTYIGAVAAHNRKIPVIWSLREFIRMQGCQFENEAFAFSLINCSAKIVAVSEYIKKSYRQLETDKTEIIYEGVDYETYYKKREILKESDGVSIIVVGALTALKGQEDLIKAAKILKDKEYAVKLKLVGNGDADYIEYLKNLTTQYGLQAQISFVGRQEKVEELYWQSDIAVMSSRGDAFGRTTVEAQLAGCLVIGADAGATSEIVTDMETGMLYQAGNAEELATKLECAVLNINSTRKIALQGQESALQYFTTAENVKKYVKIYKELGV